MRRLNRAFTLIEVSVIIVVLAILAAALAPNLAAWTRSQQQRAFLDKLMGIGADARETAISQGHAVSLEFDDSANEFHLRTVDANGDTQNLGTVAVAAGLKADRFLLGTNEIGPTEWKLKFYPNGSADGGGVELSLPDGSPLSLQINAKTGTSKVLYDRLPDSKTEQWQAGDYVHRTQ